MFDHVGLRATDRAASEAFYTEVLATLDIAVTDTVPALVEWDDFALSAADGAHAPTRGLHIAFKAPSRAHVDAFWERGRALGAPDAGAPGPRPQYREDYYGAFLMDPEGNSAEAVHHGAVAPTGDIDHLWIRVADVAAAHAFYDTIAPHAALTGGIDNDGLLRYRTGSGSFTLLADGSPPTSGLHIAFSAVDQATVDAFHAAAVGAGYTDHGGPGERPRYHAGYYGAFVLDPGAINVEVVHQGGPD